VFKKTKSPKSYESLKKVGIYYTWLYDPFNTYKYYLEAYNICRQFNTELHKETISYLNFLLKFMFSKSEIKSSS